MNTWKEFLEVEKSKEYYSKIVSFVQSEKEEGKIIYPTENDIFNAFKLTPFESIKCVILGQDPYISPNQAHGLSFSVLCQTLPKSLKNIFKELKEDLSIDNKCGNLTSWAEQGVMLLNTFLTVEEGKSNSHAHIGWNNLTDAAITLINSKESPVVFVLWGAHAQKKKPLITNKHHLILCSVHPSPLSAHGGFFGSKPFSKTNQFLESNNIQPIDWSIPL